MTSIELATSLLINVIINVPSKLWVCTKVMRHAHTRKLGAHINVPSKNVFCTYFIHFIPKSDEFRLNVAQKKLYAHTDFRKLEGTLVIIYGTNFFLRWLAHRFILHTASLQPFTVNLRQPYFLGLLTWKCFWLVQQLCVVLYKFTDIIQFYIKCKVSLCLSNKWKNQILCWNLHCCQLQGFSLNSHL